jgi:DNA polymerase III delta prime subunit
MDTLDEYFQGPYREEKQVIEHIDDLLSEIWPIFYSFYYENGWPYQIGDEEPIDIPRKVSFSTNSMILFVMALALGWFKKSILLPTIPRHVPFRDGISSDKKKKDEKVKFESTFARGFEKIILESRRKFTNSEPYVFDSPSFGLDDPFTLTWFLELVTCIEKDGTLIFQNSIENFKGFRQKAINSALCKIKKVFEKPDKGFIEFKTEEGIYKKTDIDHAFPLLRVIHLYKVLSILGVNGLSEVERYKRESLRSHLFSRIHQHLSFFNITDSMFDAAELVFYIEGLLLIEDNSRSIDKNLLDRAFNIIEESQKRSPYWRPLKPFVTTPRGLGLLPLSVEIANSLLRICKYLENYREVEGYFSKYVDLFKRYASWLFSRVARGTAIENNDKRLPFTGWHSEHVHVPRKIHPWETSQAILFLMQYQSMLQEHIARMSLKKANLAAEKLRRKNEQSTAMDYWQSECEIKEPFLGLSKDTYKVFAQIRTHYIEPRINNHNYLIGEKKPNCSMLLYGPPGTGKSSIAEDLANTLNWRLIRIAPSDFIARGEAEVEARAKNIFQTLGEQENVVILFDEIDRLILDRDSKLYREQSDIFKFMTPGMLVKLNKLWEKHSSIFIIVTNYEEHIDPAAKRTGRIDYKFLVTPTDKQQRLEILKREIKEKLKKELDGPQGNLETLLKELTRQKLEPIVNQTALSIYGELKKLVTDAVDNFLKPEGVKSVDNLIKVLKDVWKEQEQPAIRLTSYKNRFRTSVKDHEEKENRDKEFAASQEPFPEFFLLLYLKLEVADFPELAKDEINVARQVLKRIITKDDLAQLKRGKVNGVRDALSEWIKDEAVIDLLLKKFLKMVWGK